ncbi:MAG: GAF domain-containing protein, partial [Candidatus Rokubacteria bacterium]|nr:GAF domain-containing protein [Candidatus Rokubacteria bacterium]
MKRSTQLGDPQPMLAAIAKTAARLCEANDALIFLAEGDQSRLVGRYGRLRALRKLGEVNPLTLDTVSHRAILERRTIHVRDLTKTARAGFVDSRAALTPLGVRTVLATPLLRDGVAIGAIAIRRTKVRPFTPKQIALLKTFADQAAIAIENARLFKELQTRNGELTEALEQQTATSEILRVISSSHTSLEPVFSAILSNATTLCEANLAALWRYDGEYLVHGAAHNASPEFVEFIKRNPQRPSPEGPARRAAFERRPVHVVDLLSDPSFKSRTLLLTEQARTVLAIPLLRERALVGVII